MKSLVYLNGNITPPEEAKVSVMDRGFLFGDGVYEAGRSYDRCFLYLEEHWKRFRKSASRLKIEIPVSNETLSEQLYEVARATNEPNICFRTIITRGVIESVGLGKVETLRPTLCHIVYEISKSIALQWENGVTLGTSTVVRNSSDAQDPDIKTSNYLNCLLAHQDVQTRGGGEAVLCDKDGVVTEGSNFSIFGIQKGVLITPSMEVGILDSITRRHVLTIAKDLKLKSEEGYFSLDSFKECEEVFIVSSTRELVPVTKWDESNYQIGQTTKILHQRFRDDIKKYVSSHQKY